MSIERVTEVFSRAFGGAPTVVASAPARVNLIGEHTDYNGGEVLPIAIGRRTYVAVRASQGERCRAISANESAAGEFDPRAPERVGEWWDYLAGVAIELRRAGVIVDACDIAVWSDVPESAGLSSSAALEVATASAFVRLYRGAVGTREIALLCQRAESLFVGVASGIMDQFASALATAGHALHIYCATGETEQIPMEQTVLIFDTAVPRSLRTSAFNTRRAECEAALAQLRAQCPELRWLAQATPEQVREANLPDPLDRRALHVTTETRRVGQVVRALEKGEQIPGDVLLASQESLRMNYECSSPELDWFVERAMREPGIAGARLTGAGWGGCAIAVGESRSLADAAPGIVADYAAAFGRDARTWITRAERGARVESV